MCGIIAYKGIGNNTVIFEGLKRLEYRGYDSWGFAEMDGETFKVIRKTGEISNEKSFVNSSLAIGHTRWATHGGVTVENAHPHVSNDGRTAVVHNGIVENYRELKERLSAEGFEFFSETDTEVIPNLIQFHMRTLSFEDAVRRTVSEIEGSYAVVAANGNTLIGARRGSPLVLGLGEREYFLSSDIPAFMDKTKKVVYLRDDDFVVIKDGFSVENLGVKVERPVQSIGWDEEQAKKGDFDHFMLKEISEQAETIQKAIQQDSLLLEDIAALMNSSDNVFMIACGSSYHACLTSSYLFSRVAKKIVVPVLGSEFDDKLEFLDGSSMVIAVSQSGETADVLDAVKKARMKGCRTACIVNVVNSSLSRECDRALTLNAGPEICVLSTKSYTSQVALLSLLAFACAGKTKEGKQQLKNLYNDVFNLTSANMRTHINELALIMKESKHAYLMGRGLQYPTALEAALKIKEVSYIHAEGWAGGELKHGSIALIEKGSPVIVFFDSGNEKVSASNAMETKARGAYIIGVGPKNDQAFDFFIKVPDAGLMNPLLQVIPMQILAYELALMKNLNPDKPRNLAKSVTVK